MGDATANPKVVIVLSGKRKVGKDYVANIIKERLGSNICNILRLSAPLKYQYAKEHTLNYDELLMSTLYKEVHRAHMIGWGEEQRQRDSSVFCRLATQRMICPVWVVSDARRITDIAYFRENYPQSITVRIEADNIVRQDRGFVFTPGVDDSESECSLDSMQNWDLILCNNTRQQLEADISSLIQHVNSRL